LWSAPSDRETWRNPGHRKPSLDHRRPATFLAILSEWWVLAFHGARTSATSGTWSCVDLILVYQQSASGYLTGACGRCGVLDVTAAISYSSSTRSILTRRTVASRWNSLYARTLVDDRKLFFLLVLSASAASRAETRRSSSRAVAWLRQCRRIPPHRRPSSGVFAPLSLPNPPRREWGGDDAGRKTTSPPQCTRTR
jgi:hypothetical protein